MAGKGGGRSAVHRQAGMQRCRRMWCHEMDGWGVGGGVGDALRGDVDGGRGRDGSEGSRHHSHNPSHVTCAFDFRFLKSNTTYVRLISEI